MQHARAIVGFVFTWVLVFLSWLFAPSTLDRIELIARIALTVMGIVAAYYTARYWKRRSAKA